MFAKVFALFALLAVAFASPKPDILTYGAPGVVSTYPGALAYSGYPYVAAPAYTYAAAPAYPYAYSGVYYK